MDHIDWYEFSTTDPVKVPYVCGDGPLCDSDEFFDFPQRQGWGLDRSESLAQLAERAQAWLFFGLLAVAGVHHNACIDFKTGEHLINTKMLPYLLNFAKHTTELRDHLLSQLFPALAKTEDVILEELIPLIKDFEALDPLDLWTSKPYAILYSIDTLLDSIKDSIARVSAQSGIFDKDTISGALGKLRPGSFFPKLTEGVARSLLHTGRCGSLAHRLDFTSSKFYRLMSLPNSQEREDHSLCGITSCIYSNVDRMTYQTRHTRDCIMCDGVRILESELVDLIRQDEVPVIRSTMSSNGNVTICVEKMTKGVDYIAISHVWAGGLGNFVGNQLPQCQMQAIHEDVSQTMVSRFGELVPDLGAMASWYPSFLLPQKPARSGWLSSSTTFRYWMDTLCIPNNCPDERRSAINSMGRIYAGAAAVLVLDPTLRSVTYDRLGGTRANILIEASPWMARSWPLQEAALANEIYVKFAEGSMRFEHEHLGIEATLRTLPNKESDEERRLNWFSFEGIEGEFATGNSLPHTPNEDFVKAWNLLAKRTTSYPEDVPAIFAALIYKSAGEILSIQPTYRTWALLNSVDAMPLDILCVEQDSQLPQWIPRLPGSSKPVPALDTRFGILERVADGFALQLTTQSSTRVLICPKGLSASGGYFLLHEGHSRRSFLVHLPAPPGTGDLVEVEESHIILMLRKRLPGSSSTSCGVLCKTLGQTGETLRVQLLSNTITWRCHNDGEQLPAHETRDCLSADPSYTILIEMDTEHWPSLTWSRLDAYPYRHLQEHIPAALRGLGAVYGLYSVMLAPFAGIVVAGFGFFEPQPLMLALLGTLPARAYLDVLYFIHGHIAADWRARYFWSMSFWDVPESKATLSQIPLSVPLYFIAFDLTIIAGIYAAFMTASQGPVTTSLLIIVEIGYLLRFLGQVFLLVQWFLSNLEHRSSRRLHQTLYTSTLKFASSSVHANLSPALLFCFTGVCAGVGLLLSYVLLGSLIGQWRARGMWVIVLLPGVLSFGFGLATGLLSLYILFKILRDLVRRARNA
ncbi:hypothetical protein F4679DRAFT_499025 [Xylaria curta]|nr:hypothetical protein F4679DRAFT_499025 [Xylaria curta]